MKKAILCVLVAAAALGLGACSRSGPAGPTTGHASSTSSTPQGAPPAESPASGAAQSAAAPTGSPQVAAVPAADSPPPAAGTPASEVAPPLPKNLVSSKDKVEHIQNAAMDYIWAASDEWFHVGDYERAVADMRLITAGEPNFVEGYCSGGNLLESLGRHKDAEAYFKQGVAANPTSSKMYYVLGMFYYQFMKDYPAAIAVYEQDIKLDNADVNDWKMLAHAYEKTKQMDKAVATWKKIYARWPNGPSVKSNYDRIMRKVNADKP